VTDLIYTYLRDKGFKFINSLNGCRIYALYFIGSTKVSTIPGVSAAGAKPELTLYTPACDVEFLVYGKPKSLNAIPVTPEGIPTPALITRACIKLTELPFNVVDCGSYVEPKIPHIKLPSKYVGELITTGHALPYERVKALFNESSHLAKMLGKLADAIVVGESIPGGTTTALGILVALGYNAWGKVSSSSPNNPHNIKEGIVKEGLKGAGLSISECREDPFKAVSALGDPVHISIAGFLVKALELGIKVLLAGGTQMTAVLAIAKHLGADLSKDVVVGTTRWIIQDNSSSIISLIQEVAPDVPVVAAPLDLTNAPFNGLRYYEEGYVKEGVGAGGTTIVTILKRPLNDVLNAIYSEYSKLVT